MTPRLRLVQLPVPPPAALVSTGNVPLAAGCLAVAARVHGLPLDVEVVDPATTDTLGDTKLAELVADGEPELVGLSLYLWNTERSLHLAQQIKRRSPRTTVLVGGPEVGPDNGWVLAQDGFDVAVTGEAEGVFGPLVSRLLEGRSPAGLPGVAVREGSTMGPFAPAPAGGEALTQYPSPYLDGTLAVDPGRATYLESVRGCRSHCTYCFYPRSSGGELRTLDVDATAGLVAAVRDRGAREVTFLDPTFNHRPGFVALVDALARVNVDRRLSFFAEVRSEGLTPAHAKALAAAGFDRLEIGLQSVNKATLARVRRGGDPRKVAAAAKMLRDEGVALLVDLIVGLPGDTRDDVRRGVEFLVEEGLAEEAQVFLLAVLPGTAMRADASALGLEHGDAPPYLVRRTATMDQDALVATLLEAETALGRRLDETARPHLVDGPGDDVFVVDVDRGGPLPTGPGARHAALWLVGRDLAARDRQIGDAIAARLAVDPHAVLDVVLAPEAPPHPSLVADVRRRLDAGPTSYASRALAHRGEDLLRRVTVVRRRGLVWPDGQHLGAWRECGAAEALTRAQGVEPLRVVGAVPDEVFAALARFGDPDRIAFASRAVEARWQAEVQGYG